MLNTIRLKDGSIYCPPVSAKVLNELNGNELHAWMRLRADYCSFASQEQKKFKAKKIPFDNTLTCLNKTVETLAKLCGYGDKGTLSRMLGKLEAKGLVVRLSFQDRNGNRRNNLVVLDCSMQAYQEALYQCAKMLTEKSCSPKGNKSADKSLANITPYLEGDRLRALEKERCQLRRRADEEAQLDDPDLIEDEDDIEW